MAWVREERWKGDIVQPNIISWPGGISKDPLPLGFICGIPTKDNKVAIVQGNNRANALLTMDDTLVVRVWRKE